MNLVKKAAQDALMEAMRRGITPFAMKPRMTPSSERRPRRNSGGSKSSSGMSLVTGHSDRIGRPSGPSLSFLLLPLAPLSWAGSYVFFQVELIFFRAGRKSSSLLTGTT